MSRITPESKVKAKVTKVLKELGVWYFFPLSNGLGKAGIPDIICCVNGVFVSVETKADKTKKPTQLQLICADQIKAAGGYWLLVYDDATTDELRELICLLLRTPRQSPYN